MSGSSLRIATRLEFVTLDELENGFADRLGDSALFLSRSLLGTAPDELYVGAEVHVDIETANGERALSVDGVIAWAYPAHPRTPPGREPGAGILIDRHSDDDSRARALRMQKRPGAGGRVRAPGTRLPAARAPLTRPGMARGFPLPATTTPPPFLGTQASRPPSAPVASEPAPPAPPPLPTTLLAPPSDATPLMPPAGHEERVAVDDASGELVVPMPPAPQPRVMAMGMFVDQSFDPTPTPAPLPLPPELADALPDALPDASSQPAIQRMPALASLLVQPPADVGHVSLDDTNPPVPTPRPISLEGLPDAPPVPGGFEQRQTDVDLLTSLDDSDFFPAELEEQRRAARLVSMGPQQPLKTETASAHDAPPPVAPVLPEVREPSPSFAGVPLNPALLDATVTSWNQIDD
ncbi:MAG TPA: hypothetical protein VGO62_15370, partial [Myxococcota bacterium]